MKKAIMTQPGKIEFVEEGIPQPGADQVLVKMERIGVCGSDIHVWHGTHPFTSYPVTQGHEVSGTVVQVGPEVKNVSVGQRITLQPQVICGECYNCRHGKYNLCEKLKVMGFQTTGCASEYFAVDAKKVLALPDSLSFDAGAMLEPLAVAVHAVNRAGDVSGKSIAVLGAGPIGNLVAQTARGFGAADVLITDISQYRLNLAAACGIPHTMNSRDTELGAGMEDAFGPDKADVIFDCAATDATIGQAIRYARKGSQIILVGVFGKMAHVDLAVLNDHELDLNTSMMYRREDFEKAIELVNRDLVHLEPLMSQHFPFEEYAKAYQFIDANREKTMKVLIDIPGADEE